MGSHIERWKEAGRADERERQRQAFREHALTIPELRADAVEQERARLRSLLERCEALARAQLHLNQRLRRPDDEAGALLGGLLADLRRELGLPGGGPDPCGR